MTTPKLTQLQVLADPSRTGQHPYHNSRYITTAGAFFEETRHFGKFEIEKGSVVAILTDCQHQAAYARLFAGSVELLEAARQALPFLLDHVAMTPQAGPADRIALDRLEAAIIAAGGAL